MDPGFRRDDGIFRSVIPAKAGIHTGVGFIPTDAKRSAGILAGQGDNPEHPHAREDSCAPAV